MRFRRTSRPESYQETPRKRAAFLRKQRLEREALPLFAEAIAAGAAAPALHLAELRRHRTLLVLDEVHHLYNAVLKRVLGKGRAQMTLSELEAARRGWSAIASSTTPISSMTTRATPRYRESAQCSGHMSCTRKREAEGQNQHKLLSLYRFIYLFGSVVGSHLAEMRSKSYAGHRARSPRSVAASVDHQDP